MDKVLRILHLEDDPDYSDLVKAMLEKDGLRVELVLAGDYADFIAALGTAPFDIILADYSLPSCTGLEALQAARQMCPDTPVLLISGAIGEHAAIESLRCGAADCVLKQWPERLVPAVRRALREAEERGQRKALEAQLRQAQKMEEIGQLAGGVAHDFNNLLVVIRGNAEIVLMDPAKLSQENRECLGQIIAAAERAANLTRQLLVFSRKQPMQFQPLNLNQVVENLSKMLNRIIGENIEVQCSYEPHLPFVNADVGMMEQVLVNLVVNARDAMPRGGRLVITTQQTSFQPADAPSHPEARAGQFVCLSVSDTGTGIAPEHLPHIFEPFFTTKPLGKGTGLGLATVYGIVKQHEGWVGVSTQVGSGAIFKIFLPAVAPPAAGTETLQAEQAGRGGSEGVLLVEDDLAVRLLTRRLLESSGYRVWEATTGPEALELWHHHVGEIDLLLTDVVMPEGMTGHELAELVRAQKPGLKVIFISGYGADATGKSTEFIRRTRRYFLQKPFPAAILLDTVRQCLDENLAVTSPRTGAS